MTRFARLLISLTFLFTISIQAQPVQSRAATPDALSNPGIVANGKYYALVIGINAYTAPMPTLKTAENDAVAVGDVLSSRYGFHVDRLLGARATRINILDTINRLGDQLGEQDNLLIYYAGHGAYDERSHKAYWLPVDADEAQRRSNRISADDLLDEMRASTVRHILIISDSCFSGDLDQRADFSVPPANGMESVLMRKLSLRSRTLMASGGNEPVADSGGNGHSIFADALLSELRSNNEDMVAGGDILRGIEAVVAGGSKQLPKYTYLPDSGHADGDFIFVRSSVVSADFVSTSPAIPIEVPKVSPQAAAPDFSQGIALFNQSRFTEALPLLTSGCNLADTESCTSLGIMYDYGFGVAKNETQAAAFYRKACDGGDAHGCTNLGVVYQNGLGGVAQDKTQAVAFYRKACDGGDANGCTNLGFMYEDGTGIAQDKAQAIALFRKGCDGGNIRACDNLKRLQP